MEVVVAVSSLERGLEFVVPLSMAGIRTRAVVSSGNQLLAELNHQRVDAIVVADVLPDGPAEHWLSKIAGLGSNRPFAVVAVSATDGPHDRRARLLAVYGSALDLVQSSARFTEDVASEAGRLISRWAENAGTYGAESLRMAQVERATSGPYMFIGLTGGVGTSTLVANLAAFVAAEQRRVLVVDAQFATGGNVLYQMGIAPQDQHYGLHHLRRGYLDSGGVPTDGVADAVIRRLTEIRFRGLEHTPIHALHVPAALDQMVGIPAEHVIWGLQVLERFYDVVLVDCGTGIGDPRTLKLVDRAGQLVLVAGTSGGSMFALGRFLEATERQLETERIVYLLREGPGEHKKEAASARTFVSDRLPDEPRTRQVRSAESGGRPLVIEHPNSSYSQAVMRLARNTGMVPLNSEGKPAQGARRLWSMRLHNG